MPFNMNGDYSAKKVSRKLLKEIKASLASLDGWGSVEVYVQDGYVTQIAARSIKKVTSTKKIKDVHK